MSRVTVLPAMIVMVTTGAIIAPAVSRISGAIIRGIPAGMKAIPKGN
jgi:hypothetical protein